jgi:hypothetical protein
LNDDDENASDDDEWVLTSPDLSELQSQYDRVLSVPFEFVRLRGARFPPADNRRGPKSAGDIFSLAMGEVLDVLQPAGPAARRNAEMPIAQPVIQQPPADSSPLQLQPISQPPIVSAPVPVPQHPSQQQPPSVASSSSPPSSTSSLGTSSSVSTMVGSIPLSEQREGQPHSVLADE